MALIVQLDDGSITNANSYCDKTFANAYFLEIGNSTWAALSDSAKDILLIKSFRYMEQQYHNQWKGRILTTTQNSDWPRYNAWDSDKELTGIPVALKQAQCEYAIYANSNSFYNEQTYSATGQILSESETVGPISTSTTYSVGGASTVKFIPDAYFIISRLIRPANMVTR